MTLLNSVPTACYLPSLTSKWGEGRDVTSILLEGSSTLLVDGYNGDTRATNRERSHMLWDQELERERERERTVNTWEISSWIHIVVTLLLGYLEGN